MTERDVNDLDRFWNALAAGLPADTTGIDPEKAETLRRFHTAEDVPGADPAFLARLLTDLIGDQQMPTAMPRDSVQVTNPNGHVGTFPWRSIVPSLPDVAGRRRWGFGQFSTAVLVLLVLGLVYYTLGPGRGNNDGPAVIPPVVIPTETPVPTATLGPTQQTVLDITFPAEMVPHFDDLAAGLAHWSVPPGTRSSWNPTCCPGLLFEFVAMGSYTIRAETTVRVVRADGSTEEIPADTETTLEAGDTLISRNDTAVEAWNDGAESVELISFVWIGIDNPGFGGHILDGWVSHNFDVQGPPLSPPSGPARLVLRRSELGKDSTLEADPTDDLRFVVTMVENAEGTPVNGVLISRSDGARLNVGVDTVPIYVLTVEWFGEDGGTPGEGSPAP